MKTLQSLQSTREQACRALPPAAKALFAASLWALLAVGCGGGVGSGGTGVGSYTSGTITGFGSVIVNSVRFDDAAAVIRDDNDVLRSSNDLKLGMQVDIEADTIASDSSGRSAKASVVRFGSELMGPVSSINLAGATLGLLGQTVQVGSETVFDSRLAAGLASVSVGQVLEVYAQFDADSGRYRASRIEPRSGATAWLLRGSVVSFDALARVLRVGNAQFSYAGASAVPANLAAGLPVRMQLAVGADSMGRYTVQSFGVAQRALPDRPQAELRGFITAFTSSTNFSINGIAVDARSARFPDGTAGLKLGARVEIAGQIAAGTLVASSVSIESEAKVEQRGFDFRGPISAVNALAKTMVVRGETISIARTDLRIDNGSQIGRAHV